MNSTSHKQKKRMLIDEPLTWTYREGKELSSPGQVRISEGNSEHVAHAWRKWVFSEKEIQ